MAGRMKNLSKGRAGNFNPTQLGHPSALSKGAKALMAKGYPMKAAVGKADKGGDNFKPSSKNWHQPGKC